MIGQPNQDLKAVRNQQTKDFIFLIQSSAGQGSTATCFYDKTNKKSISFKNNHLFADQDVQHQRGPDYDHKNPNKLA